MRLLIYDTEMQTANAYIPNAIATAASKLLGASNVHLCNHCNVVKYAASGAGRTTRDWWGWCRSIYLDSTHEDTNIRILWTTEDPYERRLIQRVEPAFHFIFSNEQSCDGSNSQTSFLPRAAEPDLHFRKLIKSDDEYEFDLTFVGTAWPNRVASLERTISFLPDNIKVFLCLPWNRHIPQPRLETVDVIPQLRLEITDLCDIWNRSRTVLTIGRDFSLAKAGEKQIQGVSPPPRIYETALAGGYQIVLGGKHFQLPGKYSSLIQIARDEKTAAELIKKYLAEPENRISDAIEMQEYTLEPYL